MTATTDLVAKLWNLCHMLPQDPNDEPASVLLGRIRAERRRDPSKRIDRTMRGVITSSPPPAPPSCPASRRRWRNLRAYEGS